MTAFVTALIGPPFGVNGAVRIRALSGETSHFSALKTVLARRGAAERLLRIEQIFHNAGDDVLVVKFNGIDTPEAAREINGMELCVTREQAAPLREGEYYIEELKTLRLVTADGLERGIITDVVEGGGGFLIETRLPDGEQRFVPFRNEFIGAVLPENGTVELLNTWILT